MGYRAGQRARALLEAAQSVDSVIGLVDDIAGTVNLLSLNATIEAARACEAGRGFSVVASEIRSLSDQTHSATQIIPGQVQALQDGIRAVANDYSAIETAIATMVESSGEIDRAISGEADSTRLFAHSVGEASSASTAIVHAVRSASTSARELEVRAA